MRLQTSWGAASPRGHLLVCSIMDQRHQRPATQGSAAVATPSFISQAKTRFPPPRSRRRNNQRLARPARREARKRVEGKNPATNTHRDFVGVEFCWSPPAARAPPPRRRPEELWTKLRVHFALCRFLVAVRVSVCVSCRCAGPADVSDGQVCIPACLRARWGRLTDGPP